MRVAALALGVLAGLVASLILALGGLEVSSATAAAGDRQAQAISFAIYVIANLGVFAAALALSFPLAATVLMVLGALGWVGAALLSHHSTDLVLITPPALLLLGAVFGAVAHFRRPQPEIDDPRVEIIAPERESRARMERPDEDEEDQPDLGMPAFAAEAQAMRGAPRRGVEADDMRPSDDDWDPRRRRPPPPRARADFRSLEEDEEPSAFSRLALGLSGVLSFGLYAALAGAAVLIFWTLRNEPEQPVTVAAAETPSLSAPSLSSVAPREISIPAPSASVPPPAAPALSSAASSAESSVSSASEPAPVNLLAGGEEPIAPEDFGGVFIPGDPLQPPRLSNDVLTAPPEETAPEGLSEEPVELEPDPEVETFETGPPPANQLASVAAPGQPMPFAMPPQMAALRTAPGTGPTLVSTPLPPADTTGL